MKNVVKLYSTFAAKKLCAGKIGAIPTETIYGIATCAFNSTSVDHIFDIKHRPKYKPFAVLLSDFELLDQFGLVTEELEIAKPYWPGPFTIIFTCTDPKWQHLHRGTGGISFRIPNEPNFRNFLRESGPLAATSANLSANPPITDVNLLIEAFGDKIDIYMESNPSSNLHPSTVIDIRNHQKTILRK